MNRARLPVVVMVSTDASILKEGSAAHRRMCEYGALFVELHIILFTRYSRDTPKVIQIGQNVLVYSTRSFSRWRYIADATQLGRGIIEKLLKRLLQDRIVISTQDPFETGLVGRRLARQYGVALQVQVHTDFLDPHFCRPTFSLASLLNRIRLRMAPATLAEASAVRVVSPRIRKALIDKYMLHSEKVQVLPIYVDPFAWALSQDTHARVGGEREADWLQLPHWQTTGLMACRLTKEKQVDMALRVFAKVLQAAPQTGLIIAGEGPERPHLERLVWKLNIEHSVLFVGWQKRLLPFFHSADFLLSTSLYEGYGMTMVEAMLAGVPVISTDTGIAGDVLIDGRNGFVFRTGDSDALLAKMTKMILHPELRQRFGDTAARDARKHTYPSHGAYLKAYQEGVISALARHA